MMIDTKLTKLALSIAEEAHCGQVDKGGNPYIKHLKAVGEQMTDELSTCVALLHDIFEDTDENPQSLMADGIPESVIPHIQVLTRPAGTNYMAYIQNVALDPVAKMVKIADLRNNLDVSRLGRELTERDFGLVKRYQKALEYLLFCKE